MTTPSSTTRTDPPLAADEATTLVAFLDYHRDTLRLKTEGLTAEQLGRRLPPSTLTLGALLKHVALNEASWFGRVLHGREMPEPWASADWDADRDWEMTSAAHDSPDELRRLMDGSVEQARRDIDAALADGGLDFLSAKLDRKENRQFTLRWILLHMIEEYARHNGHADFLRENVDGVTGE
ncbi:MAG: DinB family protein [Dermatophilaceae bacterium]|nr:DinB family protein [Dermatophilaceae bacterium]NUR80304.1 DinB family protein [Dermatophilaceae bacterium]